eukprot:SAG11_NODE_1646_length_4523_cov_1.447559_6_plen_55_part_00
MKAGQYRFQMNNLAWTLLTIMLVVVQMQVCKRKLRHRLARRQLVTSSPVPDLTF